jgi:hypothetical protein
MRAYEIIAVITFIVLQIYSIIKMKEEESTKWWFYPLNFIINVIGGILWPLFWLLRLIGIILQMKIEEWKNRQP